MLSNFLRSFIKYSNQKKIFLFINETLSKLTEKDIGNPRKYLYNIYSNNIRNNMSNYYLIKYINLNSLLNNYMQKIGRNNIDSNNNVLIKSNNIWNPIETSKIISFSDNMYNTYYSNTLHSSKIGDSLMNSLMLLGINSNITKNDIKDFFSDKIKENEEIYNILRDYSNIFQNKNISIGNTGYHHRSSSSMNEKLFQQQKYDRNFMYTNPFHLNEKYMDYNEIISVNTFVPISKASKKDLYSENKSGLMFISDEAEEEFENMHPKKNTTMTQQIMKNNDSIGINKKKINQKSKPTRLNYNSLTNVTSGAMAKHAGDEDENISIPEDI